MLISYNQYLKLINEQSSESPRDKQSTSNEFRTRPKAILISDTYNNPFWPVDHPRLDSSKFDLPKLSYYYRAYYSNFSRELLPYHYVIEFIDKSYYVINTRPINLRIPLSHNRLMARLNDPSQYISEYLLTDQIYKNIEFMKSISKMIELDQCIYVAVIGDSTSDIYPRCFYEVLLDFCILPIIRHYKLSFIVDKTIINITPTSSRLNIRKISAQK